MTPPPPSFDILTAGFVNVETQVRVEGFPIEYAKSRFVFDGTTDTCSGVALNVASALKALGHEALLATALGQDLAGGIVRQEVERRGLVTDDSVFQDASVRTARSVILTDPTGRGNIFTDLKNHQALEWPAARVEALVARCRLVHATNINWGLQFAKVARAANKSVSTDVHAMQDLDDPYNSRFLALADIVFLSGERLSGSAISFAESLMARYPARLLVVGLGADGAMVVERGAEAVTLPATPLRPIVSATGCGDALAAAFLSSMMRGFTATESLRRAQLFAGWKIGEAGGSNGHLSRQQLDDFAEVDRKS